MKLLWILVCMMGGFNLFSLDPDKQVDIAIIGGGCSGLSAALVLSEYDWKTVVLAGPQKGGHLNVKTVVGNWPGRLTTRGYSIIKDLEEQLGPFKSNIQDANVVSCDFTRRPFELTLSSGKRILAKTVLIATGTLERKLNARGFDTYWGRGIWSNDEFYKDDLKYFLEAVKGKTVLVIGGGLDALRKAIYSIRGGAKKAILAVRDEEMKIDPKHKRMAAEMYEIQIMTRTEVLAFQGNGSSLQSVVLTTPKGEVKLDVENAVLAIGRIPNSALFRGSVDMDELDRIQLVTGTQQTSIPGVYAAGDATTEFQYGQGAIAAGDGMKAAYEILQYLNEAQKEKASQEAVLKP